MNSEDIIDLDSPSHSGSDSDTEKLHKSDSEPIESNSQPSSSLLKEDITNGENLGVGEGDSGNESGQHLQEMELDKDLVQQPPIVQEDVKVTETVSMVDTVKEVNFWNSENGREIVQEDSTIINHQIDGSPMLGVKRARTTYVGQESSVHVKYNFLTRASRRKLEELLQQWSEWHAQHSLSTNDTEKTVESGEETFFAALHVGQEKSSAVSFWMDEQTSKETNRSIPLDGDSVPLYDRGYALGLTSSDDATNVEGGKEIREASRCFNCGSYSHSIKDCTKPRDPAAVDNARKQHNSKRGRTSGPRNPTRYYQESSGGKYDGLRPGILSSETRKQLGLGDLDPPPWIHRMRQIGYPPGYLDPENEDQPSGITIYADEETKEEEQEGVVVGGEDGEIVEKVIPEPKKKKTVDFPGVNAPIPAKADRRRWESPGSSSFDSSSRNRFHKPMSPHSSADAMSRAQYSGDHRRSVGDYRNDGPPGCSPGGAYGGYDPNYASESQSPRLNPIPRSPNLGRSLSDRSRRSSFYEGSPNYGPPHNSLPNMFQSPQSYGSPNFDRWDPNFVRHEHPHQHQHQHQHQQHHHRRM